MTVPTVERDLRRRPRVAFGDFDDDRVKEVVAQLLAEDVIDPVVVTDRTDLDVDFEIVQSSGEDQLTTLARVVARPDVDAGISGSISSSAAVIRAGIKGLAPSRLVTGCFIMRWDGAFTTFADCSVVPDPTDEQLAIIAGSAADLHWAATGIEPRVGMLSFSTNGSATHEAVAKVRRATDILRTDRPDLLVEGELQFDAAVDPAVGLRKFPGSSIAGRANVLIFPTLDAGNIAYKVAERIGGAHALGSFVLNLSKPWIDLSRGCSVEDLMDTARLVASLTTSTTLVKERLTP